MRRALTSLLLVGAVTAAAGCASSKTVTTSPTTSPTTSSATASVSATTAASSATTSPSAAGAATTPPDGATTTLAKATTLAEAKAVVKQGNLVSDAQADCVVTNLVTAIGETKAIALVNDGRDLSDLPADDAKTASAALLACVPATDFAKIISSTFYDALKDVGVTEAQAGCFGDKLVATLTPEAVVALGSGATAIEKLDPTTQTKVLSALAACLPPDLLGQLGQLGTGDTTTTAKP